MTFETMRFSLTGVVDLTADPELGAAAANEPFAGFLFVQNTGSALVYWRETIDPPGATDTGHVLGVGDAVVARLISTLPFWIWAAEGDGGVVTVSAAAPSPTREV